MTFKYCWIIKVHPSTKANGSITYRASKTKKFELENIFLECVSNLNEDEIHLDIVLIGTSIVKAWIGSS